MKRFLRRSLLALAGLVLVLVGVSWFLHRRPLPVVDGRVRVSGLSGRVEIVRDRWGVPHVFAAYERDVYFGLGYAMAQDRLFQLELHRRIGQGRLAEMFGPDVLPADQLFRTVDLHGVGRRMLARARPEVREAFAAYAAGVNAAVGGTRARPVELVLLRQEFAPARDEDWVGVIGYMAWVLNAAWDLDPLYEQLVAKVGEAKAAELFPYDHGTPPGAPSAYEHGATVSTDAVRPRRDLERAMAFVEGLAPGLSGSNTWVVAPSRSASGHALLANDPHLKHGVPSVWYEAHLHAPGLDVTGFTLPGLPFVVIGHNRRIAWGLTNLMLDAGDFFRETFRGESMQEVLYRNDVAPVQRHTEVIPVRGRKPVTMDVYVTPHGPVVDHLLEGVKARRLSYRWVHAAAEDANDLDGVYLLNRANNWSDFRAAASRLGAIAQNASYADVDGHIGLQATGRLPRRVGRRDGNRFRDGGYGREEWEGFLPFEENPFAYDPPKGWLAAANNPTFAAPAPFFVSSHWEPVDRAQRIGQVLGAKPQLSVDDMRALHGDVTLAIWPVVRAALRESFAERRPEGLAAAALERLQGWDGAMTSESGEAALFAAFFEHLYRETFVDEMGDDIAEVYRAKGNLWAIMVRAMLEGGAPSWIDNVRTSEAEDRPAIVRRAFDRAVAELRDCCGADPARWSWGALHTAELRHAMARRGGVLGAYFNIGGDPVGGHALTPNKAEFEGPGDYRLTGSSPSLRMIVDMGRPQESWSVLPTGQSGVPASPHYADQWDLWRRVEYRTVAMDRAAIDAEAEGTLVLEP